MAVSGVFLAYYHGRANHVVERMAQTEQAFLGLLASVFAEHDTVGDPNTITSLLSCSADVPQGRILLLKNDSSLVYPLGGLSDIPVAGAAPEGCNAVFCVTSPEAWKEISSRHTDQLLDKKGIYVFTTFYPVAEKGETSSGDNPEESAQPALSDQPNYYKLVSFISNDTVKVRLSQLRMELFALEAAFIALSLVPLWLTAAIIVKRKHFEKKLWCVATYDTLTGVYNRTMFTEKLEYLFIQSERYSHQFGLLIINMDNFRSVNNTLGHQAGDLLLQETAARLIETLRKSDVVARLGDDEFAVILPEISRMEIAEAVAKRIMYTLAAPFSLEGDEKVVSASIGVALFPDDGNDAEAILKHAERALYYAKEQGGNNYILFRSLWRMTSD